jgi:hypothetical protein
MSSPDQNKNYIRVTNIEKQFPKLAVALAKWSLTETSHESFNCFNNIEIALEEIINFYAFPDNKQIQLSSSSLPRQLRIIEIQEAIKKLCDSQKNVPIEWHKELSLLQRND